MRRVRHLSSHKKVSEEPARVQAMTLAEAELHLAEAATLQASQLQGGNLYWGETENCLARLNDAIKDNELLGAAATAYAAYGTRQRELRKDLLRIALQLARVDSESQKRDKTGKKIRDRSSGDRFALNGSLLLLFGTLNASDGSRCCHRVAVNAESAELTHDTLNLPPLQLPLKPGKSESRRRAQKLQREVKEQKTTPGGEGLSASDDALQMKETGSSVTRSPDSSHEPKSPGGQTHTGNTCLEGLGMSSCPSAEHMDAATEGFKLGVARIVDTESVHAEHPLVSQLTSVLTAYRVGFSEAGQPDLASTKTATASTDGSAGDSGSDNKRFQLRKQQSRSRTVTDRQAATAAAAAATSSTTGHRTNRQRRSSEKPPRTEKALKSSPSTAQPSHKRLVLLTLEYQQDSKSATWRCPSKSASRLASESTAAKGAKRKQTEKIADPSGQPARRRKSSSKAGNVGSAEVELADVDAAVSSKSAARTRKSENRKSITQALLLQPQETTLTAASNSSVGKSGSSSKQKTGTVKSRKTGSNRN